MKLSLKNRLLLEVMLPKEGKFETLIVVSDIRKKIAITQKEIVEFEIKSLDSGGITWNHMWVKSEIDIEFSEIEISEIAKTLKKKSDDEKLLVDDIELYKMFVK